MWDFIVKLLKLKDPIIKQEYDSIFIIIDKFIYWYDFNNVQNTYITMICTMRCCRWIVDSLRFTRCEERSSSRIPPDPNETSAMARHAPTQYSSDNYLP